MNKWIRLIATSVASAALAGTALLSATGSASATPRPVDQVTVSTTAPDREQGHGTGDTRLGGIDPRRDTQPRHGHNNDHHVSYWRGHDGHLYRYDGHRLARWTHGHWVIIWQTHGHGPIR